MQGYVAFANLRRCLVAAVLCTADVTVLIARIGEGAFGIIQD